jgi:fumarate hydratase class II
MRAATASDQHTAGYVKGIPANRKRIDELMRQSMMLVTALAPRIGYDDAARIAKAAHLHGTNLREEALASGLVDAAEFDALVSPGGHAGARRLSARQQSFLNAKTPKIGRGRASGDSHSQSQN